MKKINFFGIFMMLASALLFLTGVARSMAQSPEDGWQVLFNGKDLTGWRELNGKHKWEARDGMIIGTDVHGQPNGFLCTEADFGDFILELEVSIDTLMNNSGVQFRSRSTADYLNGRVHGYQMEVDPKPQRWSGSIYDEGGRRGWIYTTELNLPAKNAFKNSQWNKYRIECFGTTMRTWVNGIPVAHLVDAECAKGFIGLQLHANNPTDPPGSHQVRFRNIRIKTSGIEPSPPDDIFVVNTIPDNLSLQEKKTGYSLLWDGKTTRGWKDGDFMTRKKFGAFVLKFDFRLSQGADSGIKYVKGAGEWNQAVVKVFSDSLTEYWLNGYRVAGDKYKDLPGFGLEPITHIRLEGRGGTVSYRSIKIKEMGKDGRDGPVKILQVKQDKLTGTISVFTGEQPLLTQIAKPDERPYIHPIIAPDGKGVLTQYRPDHHPHQTGLFWGLKLVNGRDYFMKWQNDYWRRVSATVITDQGPRVKWQTVYDLLDEKGNTTLRETANWSLQEQDGRYLLDLEWNGDAKTDITFGKYYVGGLFLRMPWSKGTAGEVVNSNGLHNLEAEAQRAIWTDVGMQVEGRDDWAHMAIFDHPGNKDFPIAWRVDTQLGIGPSRQIMGDWKLNKGERETVRYRVVVYTGDLGNIGLTRLWKEFAGEKTIKN